MIWSPDLRIDAKQPRLPMLRRAQWRVQTACGERGTPVSHIPWAPKETASLLAYSGGTVWALHPLPMTIGKRQVTA